MAYAAGPNKETKRQRYEKLRVALEAERSTFISHWRDLADFILPRRVRWSTTDANKGDKRNQKIIDSTATYALRTLRSGMMSGVTSPARPWFRLSVRGSESVEPSAIKVWLDVVTRQMHDIFEESNLYNALPIVYGDLGVFGTAAMSVEEDFDTVIQCNVFPVGSYCISLNEKGMVDTFERTYMMTVRQIVTKFGYNKRRTEISWDNISPLVRNHWEQGRTEVWVEVCHLICPNSDYDPNKSESKFKKYHSVYYETGTSGANQQSYMNQYDDMFLSEKGYDRFRILCPRWEVSGEDVYGTDCPGMVALGDIKQLQHGEKKAGKAIDKMIDPPMQGPSILKNTVVSILPGDITYTDVREGQQGLRPAHEVNFRLDALENKQEMIRQRIRKAFFEDLFLMLASSDRREITAREIEERHEEKLWAIGPVLQRLDYELLGPLIDITFETMVAQGLIPDPPPELQGQELKVEYVSVMAQAQKLIGLGSVERFTQFAAQIGAVYPESVDKVDSDQLLDIYGDLSGIPPGILRPDDAVAGIRDQRNQAMQKQQQMNSMQQGAQVAKDLSQSDVTGDNALSRVLGGV